MKALSEELLNAVNSAAAKLETLSEAAAAAPALPGGWSRKQLLGHLVDSASNNQQRFVRAALADSLEFPAYDTDRWSGLEDPQHVAWPTLLALWTNYNRYLAHLIAHLPADWMSSAASAPMNRLHCAFWRRTTSGT
ncbi:MAG: DinB family protein [Bryobacteraceae bacterium]